MSFLNTIITGPFSWLLLALYNFSQSYGVALILFSLIVKLILLPFSIKSKRNMMKMGRLNPKIKALEKQYKNDKEKHAQETQKLYQKYGINPMSGCLWSLLPLPIMLGLYSVIRKPLSNLMKLTADQITAVTGTLTTLGVQLTSNATYREIEIAQQIHVHYAEVKKVVSNVLSLDYSFLGINLADTPDFNILQASNHSWAAIGLFLLPVVSGALAFVSMRVANRSNTPHADTEERSVADRTTKQMSFFMPLISVYIGFVMPAGLSVYWIANSAFSIVQEWVLGRIIGKRLDAEEEEREKRFALEEEAEKKHRAEVAAQRAASGKKKSKQQPKRQATHEKGQIDDRPYARGRSYEAGRYPSSPEQDESANPQEQEPNPDEVEETQITENSAHNESNEERTE